MGIGVLFWGIMMAAVLAVAFTASRLGEKEQARGFKDTGLAILEFGRAYPTEAIRQLHATADGEVLFVRLHDNKAGYMRSKRGHYACHLIEPGTAQVSPLDNGRGIRIDFTDAPHHSGDFVFSTAEEAAEVSLWLLGNLLQKTGGLAEEEQSAV